MRVLVTGASGFIGSHITAELIADGWECSAFVRSSERLEVAVADLGVDPERITMYVGDVTDLSAVRAAVTDHDAIVHVASVFSLDERKSGEVRTANLRGAENVLSSGVEAGCSRLIHISSYVALGGPPGSTVTPESEPVGMAGAYARSKLQQERFARSLQSAGHPVSIVYPGGVFGPNDPNDGENTQAVRNIVRGLVPFKPHGGAPIVDVRDVATVVAGVLASPNSAGRWMAGGHFQAFGDFHDLVCETASVRRPSLTLPDGLMLAVSRIVGAIQRHLGYRLPANHPIVAWLIRAIRVDDSQTIDALGVTFRPTEETIADQISWMRATGRLRSDGSVSSR